MKVYLDAGVISGVHTMVTVDPSIVYARNQIIADFSKHWELNDLGHRYDHFNDVFVTGLYINKALDCGVSEKLILLAAFFHDLFTWDRLNHHVMSSEWVMRTEYPMITELSDSDRVMLSKACLEHRASGSGIYSSVFSELMAAADRCIPRDSRVEELFDRVVTSKTGSGMTDEEIRRHAIEHLQKKFNLNAAKTFPSMWRRAFPGKMEELQAAIQLKFDRFEF